MHPSDRASIRCTAVLAGTRTDRFSTTYPLTQQIASHYCPTDNILGALAIIDKISTTASTDLLLGAFGLINNLEERVQGL